jgi:hypothetical protein
MKIQALKTNTKTLINNNILYNLSNPLQITEIKKVRKIPINNNIPYLLEITFPFPNENIMKT